jgi:TrwC relaxase
LAVVATLSKGYGLDYIWKQIDLSLAKDPAGYYIQAAETGGEPPGRWWGPGAKALGLQPGEVVEREEYDLLFGERKAPDGTPLGRPPNKGRKAADIYEKLLAAEPHATAERKRELRLEATRQARQSPFFFDLTLSLSKSVSIFHASIGENARLARLARQAGDAEGDQYWSGLLAEVDEMIWQAVRAGFAYFQKEAGYTRTGSHNRRVNSRETGQWHEADLVVAHWLQHTSRDGDMQLHVHSQIAHTARTITDGKWRAPDSLGYNEHVGAVAAVVAQHLEEALTRRFGLEWVARLAQASNFATRAAKDGGYDPAQAHAGWADKLARTLGVPLASVAPSVWHEGGGQTSIPNGQGVPLDEQELTRAVRKAVALAQQEKSA